MTKKETISHDKASFYMAFKYLNKERTLEMWDYIEKNKQFAKDVARYFELNTNLTIEGVFLYSFLQSSKQEDETILECETRLETEYEMIYEKLTKGVAK